ncbi:pectate lyase superfamily protein-domain-containing protein [Stachybotrys elegans]|uniref:Pectate lyase superfamily protein-domain-containing protein n=1 Tax=Stachybotrys elegans TaxID=80388 RepID=A0A8K0WNF6_9HYPO|nr:pectate lyase superfamily protein-domain-containing protein [Stachybotrys elegans]
MRRLLTLSLLVACLCTKASSRALDQSIPLSKTILHRGPDFSASYDEAKEREYNRTFAEKRQAGSFWYESVSHGISPFGPSGYQVFRNVRDYGAVGDGVTDDTEAINRAITDGDRCGETCGSSTVTPAVVYFPGGTYLVSAPLIQYYYTQFVGNPNDLPILKAAAAFEGIGVISSNTYIPGGDGAEWYVPQSNFYRQVRNFIIDLTDCPDSTPDGFAPTGIHWQVAQATSLQNILFRMRKGAGTTHVGIFMENGSGGFLGDLSFEGGAIGMWCGSQQFTARNLRFRECTQAIQMIWDWGWTWHGLDILLCQIGINVTALTSPEALHNQGVASIAVLDSVFTNVPIGILTSGSTNTMLENVQLRNVPIAIGYSGGPTVLPGGDVLIGNYGNGDSYVQNGDDLSMSFLNGPFQHTATSAASPSLRGSGGWFARSKPQYESFSPGNFIDVRSRGAVGNGLADDTDAINSVLASAGSRVVYFPHGIYRVTDTIRVPPGTRMVGEVWSEIMGFGPRFHDISEPRVMVQVGEQGSSGSMEISDMLFTVSGPTAGAILMEWNIAQSSQGNAAMWDAHFRVGGAVGSSLQFSECPWSESAVNTDCIAATTLLHVTASANGYFENVWIWTADHDLDLPAQSQVSVYTARCFLVESQGPVWLWGTGAEHSTLYQYRFYKARNIFAAVLQTETPYYQPQPKAPAPFTGAFALPDDPTFTYCDDASGTCAYAWGMEIIGSVGVFIYGAGFYSWFQWYNQACLRDELCQERIARVVQSDDIYIANLYTKGSISMIQGSSSDDVIARREMNGFLGTIVGWTGLSIGGVNDSPIGEDDGIPLPPWIWDVPNPTVSCMMPCRLLPPPTPILPIQPPVVTTTLSGTTLTLTPPVIETPYISVRPITVALRESTRTVTPLIVPTPVIDIPPIIPPGGNFPGGPPNVVFPPIPLPIPIAFLPGCLQFCRPQDWPPILPPIVVVPGNPIPVGLPPPIPPVAPDDIEIRGLCPSLLTNPMTGLPSWSDVPSWGQPGQGGDGDSGDTGAINCRWGFGSIGRNEWRFTINIERGQNSFTRNLMELIQVTRGGDLEGVAVQLQGIGIRSWSVSFQPSSIPGLSGSRSWIRFDIPTSQAPSRIDITATTDGSQNTVFLILEGRPSLACGGSQFTTPPDESDPVTIVAPRRLDGTIDCIDNDTVGVSRMTSCIVGFGSAIVQGQLLSEGSTITTENPSRNCIRSGVSTLPDGTHTNFWCIVYQANGCAFVMSDKHTDFGSLFPGNSVISGGVYRNFAVAAANQCAGSGRMAIASGPFQPLGAQAQTLCLTNPDHPEACGVN